MNLQWRDENRPFAERFDDIYYSADGGLDETRHVFVHPNNLAIRFKETQNFFTVAELGFGTGLNFLETWNTWRNSNRNSSAHLHYISCEKFMLSPEQIRRALSRWPELSTLTEKFLNKYIELPQGFYRFHFDDDRVFLTLLIGDAHEQLSQLKGQVDAWYFDGFSPSKNPDLWSEEIFHQVARLSKYGTTFATYTASGFVRRHLSQLGFEVQKIPGFARKREMLTGKFRSESAQLKSNSRNKHTVIVGGGIAGYSVASALQRRGHIVTVIDRATKMATGASGNPAGISLPALSAEPTPLSQLGLSGLVYLRNLQLHRDPLIPSGLLQLGVNDERISKWKRGLELHQIPKDFARLIDQHEASDLAGLQMPSGGLFFSHAGALSLPDLTRALSLNIPTLFETEVSHIEKENGIFKIYHQSSTPIEAEQLVLCHAHDMMQLTISKHLPLRKIRGQIAMIRSQALRDLKIPLCFENYITPSLPNGTHLLGATYDRENLSSEIRPSENQLLLQNLEKSLGISSADVKVDSSRVNFRTSCPGQSPMVGELYDSHGEIIENAFMLTALASRGSIYAGILAELLAAKINGEPLPLPHSLDEALSPLRFRKS